MGSEPKRDLVIGLIGMTGAGKTTFASVASGQTNLKIGDTLESCTQEPQAVTFSLGGYNVLLIDTPGFEDSKKTDLDILMVIAKWISDHKSNGGRHMRLDGLILLHPITANQIGDNERKRARLLEVLLGEEAYKRVIIATTMWDDLNDDEWFTRYLENRFNRGEVWREMQAKGATVLRHYNNQASAHDIIGKIIEKSKAEGAGVEFQIQKEMAESGGKVHKTSVGKQVMQFIQDDIDRLKDQRKTLQSAQPRVYNVMERKRWMEDISDLNKQIKSREKELWWLDKLNLSLNWLSTPIRWFQ
ncbi:P-loop containing nucleoside triphosphate hydrolase protein [Lasiosphaeria ovina]|uniref:P-loop containing nucleoside triphosphate hydrolase protein n=1 Tax=Lasiosphaeria ovina TaxID=92902 RepID=A0AAE0JTQ8_9PEZI|nr:P-loop containing nucleoside triphosphate hydrolase protein [Lasiosphaeria ovina]